MTSEVDALKTNEFIRRRKLRILQVREQSKDIAKKIRQRASAEQFRHLVNLDASKEKEYIEQRDKFIKKLEELHTKSIGNLGASHRNATEAIQLENKQEKVDLSKQRAREAAAELRRQKQETLDERKRLLDRKLQARETANELSREKSATVANKLLKSSVKSAEEVQKSDKPETVSAQTSTSKLPDDEKSKDEVVINDMATQLGAESIPNEWEANIPILSLPKDNSPKESALKTPDNLSEKSKRTDLFALSEDMPLSLRGGLTNAPEDTSTFRPSLIVSDYIQNRNLRLRDFDSKPSSKQSTEDLQKLKQTILRTRSAKPEGSVLNPVHVADVQVIPVPSWQPEAHYELSSNNFNHQNHTIHEFSNNVHHPNTETRQFKTVSNSQISGIFSSIRPKPDLQPTPVLRGSSPFKRSKVFLGASVSAKPSRVDRSSKQDSLDNVLTKKSSVTMYNHSTRDVRDMPYGDRKVVSRDHYHDEDAYYQAMKETSSEQVAKEKEHQKKLQDMRNKIAMTKQNVEKEYKNTIEFLKCLSKEKDKPIKSAYKDAHQEQMLKELRQRKLQHEFRKIQRECRKQTQQSSTKSCSKNKFVRVKTPDPEEFNFDKQDLQYSWMPVPESDKGLAVHIIPTKIKEQKAGNSVKFSKIDSYHEYRSRHKHTPPTKDTCGSERQKVTQPDSGDDFDSEASTSTSTVAGATSVEDLRLDKDNAKSSDTDKYSEAERIIIYKILDSKSDKRAKVKKKAQKQSLSNREDIHNKNASDDRKAETFIQPNSTDNISLCNTEHSVTPKHLKEGVYKTVQQKGVAYSNVTSCYATNVELWETTCSYHPWWDNITFARFTEDQKQKSPATARRSQQHTVDVACGGTRDIEVGGELTSDVPSSSSFKTASNAKATLPQQQHAETNVDGLPQGGFVKVVNEKGQESGKLFIGATGFLKDDAYEVVIKLRKTDSAKDVIKDTVPKEQKSETTITEAEQNTRRTNSEAKSNVPIKTTADVGVGEDIVNIGDLNNKVTVTTSNHNNLVDRAVDVPFEDPYRKESSEPKPGTSVSVQTTLDSPDLRYHRMSSSTSTAYMSPPDVILPKYLNRNHIHEKYHHYAQRNPDVYAVNLEPRMCSRRTPVKPKQMKSPTVKSVQRGKHLMTPPNTARSCVSDYSSRNSSCKTRTTPAVAVPKTTKKHRCEKRKISKPCMKPHIRKAKRSSSTNLIAPPPSMPSPSRTSKLNSGSNEVNPVVKWYVDKLLHMNRQGVKAIDVLNQDCSSVTTPGSSIIEEYNNYNRRKSEVKPNISLEQLKQLITQYIMKKCAHDLEEYENRAIIGDTGLNASCKTLFRFPKKKSVHKVKSLNVSRSLISRKSSIAQKPMGNCPSSCPVSGTSSRDEFKSDVPNKQKHRSKSSPTPRRPDSNEKVKHSCSLEGINDRVPKKNCDIKKSKASLPNTRKSEDNLKAKGSQPHEPEVNDQPCLPLNTSTQTSRNIDEDIHYIKMAEDKIQNMEKIADLTEKCTQRLSNLAKVLEEVRKNKLSYSHASESASDTDQVSVPNSDSRIPVTTYEPIIEIKEKESPSPSPPEPISSPRTTSPSRSPTKSCQEVDTKLKEKKNIPQTKCPKSPSFIATTFNLRSPIAMNVNTDHNQIRARQKPPPALMRRCLKRTQEYVVPHELSTVVEVDSPISVKYKNQSSKNSAKQDDSIDSNSDKERKLNDDGPFAEENNDSPPEEKNDDPPAKEKHDDPNLLEKDNSISHNQAKTSKDDLEDSKVKMIDLKKFNDIMLKPFISIQEYAKQCNMGKLEEGSNIESLLRGDVINDEMSSLHSDGSLPDVIAELLKRNIISEPFKFDTASNINSTTVSSDSTLSVLALSKVRRSNKKASDSYFNKENMEETSDTLSNSSNPDLENAFKKLGMGWASSTLKKTKEHLALSSSSTNSSSSSLSQFKLKSVRSKEPVVTDSVSSIRNVTNVSNRSERNPPKHPINGIKSAGQQTSLSNSLTAKQFLTNELAKRITFGDNSRKNDTEEEFVSLCETKMPEDMQRAAKHGDRSVDSNQRARTSTPVQLYKSIAYHSSTSSNVSNGLFSNADDLSSVKVTSNSMRNHSTSEKDDLTIPNFSLRKRKTLSSDCSRSD